MLIFSRSINHLCNSIDITIFLHRVNTHYRQADTFGIVKKSFGFHAVHYHRPKVPVGGSVGGNIELIGVLAVHQSTVTVSQSGQVESDTNQLY